eukprot:s2568_g12.t1
MHGHVYGSANRAISEPEDSNVVWYVGALVAFGACICLLCLLYWSWKRDRALTEKRYAEPSPAAESKDRRPGVLFDDPQQEKSALSGLVPVAKQAVDLSEDEVFLEMSALRELQGALDEAGVYFASDEDDAGVTAASVKDAEMKRMMEEAGVSFDEDSIGILQSSRILISTLTPGVEDSNNAQNLQVALQINEGLAERLALAGRRRTSRRGAVYRRLRRSRNPDLVREGHKDPRREGSELLLGVPGEVKCRP